MLIVTVTVTYIVYVMGVSEVLLCPYRYLEHIMVNSKKNSKFNSASTRLLSPNAVGIDHCNWPLQ